ncbi:MAG: tRNA (adenosine(37)-N6)-threonylcarbamoyltransferase complex ATPase subunit type 1 TsaE [Pseudobdellovibrionaceae bacterium]
MIVTTSSELDTSAAAARFAAEIRPRDIILLQGDLGMGKSVFARALIRTLCGNPDMEVPSPTFTLVQTYESARGTIWHFDLYRLKDPEELYEIGWEEALTGGILLIEWPERLGYLTPPTPVTVRLESAETPQMRHIHIERVSP